METDMVDSGVMGVAARVTGDVTAVSVAFGTIINILPPLSALLSILWIGYQFYNSAPFQAWLKKRKGE